MGYSNRYSRPLIGNLTITLTTRLQPGGSFYCTKYMSELYNLWLTVAREGDLYDLSFRLIIQHLKHFLQFHIRQVSPLSDWQIAEMDVHDPCTLEASDVVAEC